MQRPHQQSFPRASANGRMPSGVALRRCNNALSGAFRSAGPTCCVLLPVVFVLAAQMIWPAWPLQAQTETSKSQLPLQAQKIPAGPAVQESKAGRDTVLKVYSINDLLEYKDFYERERFRLETERAYLRDKGIRDMENFLASHPKSKILDRVIVRLAELHYEKALEQYNQDQEQYSRQLADYEKGLLLETPVEPRKDFGRTLELYQRIIQEFPQSKLLDDAFYNKAFLLEDLGQRDEALALYEKFVQDFPDSRYVPDALFRVAEYYFNPPVQQIERAIEIYHRILQYQDSPKYDEALYRLGWSYYKLNDFPKAISCFTLLADDVKRARQFDPKNQITNPSLAEESIEYIGIAFLDYKGATAAAEYLNSVGGRQYGFDILRKIGDAYMNVKEEYDKAIEAYRILLRMYPFAPEAPWVRAKIAEAYRALDEEPMAYLQRDSLYVEYHEGSAWWNVNTDEEIRAKTHALVERALRENINLLLKRADENNDLNLYAQAVHDSRKYLSAFAKDSAAAQIHWNMALTLDAKLNQRDEAYQEYLNCSKLYWNSRFRKMAAENAVALAQEIAGKDTAASGGTSRPAFLPLNIGEMKEKIQDSTDADAANKLRRALHLERQPLTSGELKLAAAIDNYIMLFPHAPETAERLAQAGALYYNNNDFTQAIKYFKTLLRHFPESLVAEYAEYLLMESYFGKVDYKSSEIVAKRLKLNSKNEDYVRKAEQRLAESIFLQAEGLADAAEHLRAAEEYRRVYEEVPMAEFADLALHNAGLEFDQAREYRRAVETYDVLVQNFPQSPHYLPALNNMAYDYGALNDYRNAALTFERLAQEEPDSASAEVDLYNASVFYVRAEEWERAIRVNRQFVERYPTSKDAADMFYEIANFYLKLDDLDNANLIYGEYAEKFPESPRTVETFYRRGEYYEQKGEMNQAKEEYQKAIAKSRSFQARKMDANEFFAAEALYRLTEIKYREFTEIRFKLPQAQMELAKEHKKNLLLEIVDNYTRIAAYGTFRLYESTYKIGEAYEEFAATWADQEIPEVDAARRIVARKEINQIAAELYERALMAYKHAAQGLAKLADLYYNQAAQVFVTTDTTLFDLSGRVAREDTTLRVARRWIDRSKAKISEVVYDMAEINYASVQQLLEAPTPENMDKITALEFRSQLLGKYIKPLVANIIEAHRRNLAEADSFALNNHWVEKSRQKIITTQNILAREYAALSWRALSQYQANIKDYKEYVNSGDVRALELRDEMGNLIDFSRSFARVTLQSYGVTFDRASAMKFDGNELTKTEDSAFSFAYRFAVRMDSLAQVANLERQNFEGLIRQGTRHTASMRGEDLQDAVIALEDNYYSLSEGTIEILQQSFELAQKYKLDNDWSDKIILRLVKSAPEKFAGLLGLQVSQLTVPTDQTWQTATTYYSGWTEMSYNAADWRSAENLGEGLHFQGYGASRLWVTRDSTMAASQDSTASDSAKARPSPTPHSLVYFRKNFTVVGLPVSGQIQLFADDSYNLFVNGEYIAQFIKPLNENPVTHIHDFSNFLRTGDNTIALELRNNNSNGGALEAVLFVKSVPGWEQREAELQMKKARREERKLFEHGFLPIIY
ncbi:MAG: tetratricopeptide repeat protein [candidate division KSB1 bacterium]|nr:tetratricopeptide repeat protein [candidate division KSB1 bacterium]